MGYTLRKYDKGYPIVQLVQDRGTLFAAE